MQSYDSEHAELTIKTVLAHSEDLRWCVVSQDVAIMNPLTCSEFNLQCGRAPNIMHAHMSADLFLLQPNCFPYQFVDFDVQFLKYFGGKVRETVQDM